MRTFGLAIGAIAIMAGQATGAENRFDKSLQMLAPEERLEQLCDYAAMTQIRKDARHFRPERAVANATAEPSVRDHSIEAKGGAFRSRGKWYAFTYTCAASPDRMTVLSLQYTIGAKIPQSKWAAYGLWE